MMCERNSNWLSLSGPQLGDLASNSGMRPDWESNWQPVSLRVSIQSTETRQPWLILNFILLP